MNNLAIIRFKPPRYNHLDEGAKRVGGLRDSMLQEAGWGLDAGLTNLPWKKLTVTKNSRMKAALPLQKLDYELRKYYIESGMCVLFCKLAT